MEKQLWLAAQEATFAKHTAVHNHAFRSMDCTVTTVRKHFNNKFTCSQKNAERSVLLHHLQKKYSSRDKRSSFHFFID
jgi:hypothetical protein